MGLARALLIACNYPGTKYELKGCVEDVYKIQTELLVPLKFADVTVMTDSPQDGMQSSAQPTGANIKAALADLLDKTAINDLAILYYSGHGTQGMDPHGSHPHSGPGVEDEALVPCDFNLVYNEDLREIVNLHLKVGARFTMVADACHSGNLMELDSPPDDPRRHFPAQEAPNGRFLSANTVLHAVQEHYDVPVAERAASLAGQLASLFGPAVSNLVRRRPDNDLEASPHSGPVHTGQRIVLLSGCQAQETSGETVWPDGKTGGLLTASILRTVQEKNSIGNKDMWDAATAFVTARNAKQHPGLDINNVVDTDAKFMQAEE